MVKPIPVTILSGFLGSGKTTLLNHVLSSDHGLRVAVIVNEFGSVGVDGQLVEGGEQFIELANGCICCALNEELEVFLRKLMKNGGFDYVVLETTGLADPLPVAWTFARAGLEEFYRVDSLVTLIDAANLEGALEEHPMAELQIERGDLLVLNKMDLSDDDGKSCEHLIRSINRHAPIFKAENGVINTKILLGVETHNPQSVRADTHIHEIYTTWSFETEAVFDDEALEDWLYELPPEIYRIKGIVRTNYGSGWRLINGVSGRIDFRIFEPARESTTAIVFIGPNLDTDNLKQACEKLLV